jgi:hypothetical protein
MTPETKTSIKVRRSTAERLSKLKAAAGHASIDALLAHLSRLIEGQPELLKDRRRP